MSEYATPQALAGRIGAATKWATCTDRTAATEAARRAAFERFERLVDPEGKLPPAERATRAAHARKAHFLRMAAKSAATRRRRATERAEAKSQELAGRIQAEETAAAGGEVA